MTKTALPVRDICTISIFTALTAVLAQIAIPLPFTPMPISFGLVAVYMAGMLLPPKNAVFSQICYLLLGAVGVPVFGGFRGGLGALFGPTGGYLLVYPVMVAIVSHALNRQERLQANSSRTALYPRATAALCAAHLVLYLGGTLWLSATTGSTFAGALALAVYPFIPMDMVKIAFCVLCVLPIRDRVLRLGLLRADTAPYRFQPAETGAPTGGGPGGGDEIHRILRRALDGLAPSQPEALALMDPARTPLDDLIDTANTLTRRAFGSTLDLCAIYAARVGRCSGDCAFCAQSAHHSCDVKPVRTADLKPDEIVAYARHLHDHGVGRLSLVTSGERLTDSEFDRILAIYRRLRDEVPIGLCASLGGLTAERAARLREAGITRYHHNIETSESFFPQICTTHSYGDKLETIRLAREAGLSVCSGGILGMGESPAQRVEMARALKQLDVDCVPINILNPIPGTRLEHQPLPQPEELLRTIAVFRLILQEKPLRFAGGRENAMGGAEYRAYAAGLNALIIGDYLTTAGKGLETELEGLRAAGYTLREDLGGAAPKPPPAF